MHIFVFACFDLHKVELYPIYASVTYFHALNMFLGFMHMGACHNFFIAAYYSFDYITVYRFYCSWDFNSF